MYASLFAARPVSVGYRGSLHQVEGTRPAGHLTTYSLPSVALTCAGDAGTASTEHVTVIQDTLVGRVFALCRCGQIMLHEVLKVDMVSSV